MRTVSELFDATTIAVPVSEHGQPEGEMPLNGPNISVVPLTVPAGRPGWRRKALFPFWIVKNAPAMIRACRQADAVHAPVPGDIGTIGILLALCLSRPLFVRYCGNWRVPSNGVQKLFQRLLEGLAGGNRLVLATGGGADIPSERNPRIKWIFASSLTDAEIAAIGRPRTVPCGEGEFRLIIVGRQEKRKGTDRLIQALRLLSGTGRTVSLDVVGAGSELASLEELSRRLGIDDRVRFHGNLSHERVVGLLQEAHLFCFPTESEGFPKAVLEAMATGLPIVTTGVSVLPFLVKDCGLVLDEVTPETLRDAVLKMMGEEAVYESMSRAALRAARDYSLEKWQQLIRDEVEESWGAKTRTAD